VAEIFDDCILGMDFLKKANLDKILESVFDNMLCQNRSIDLFLYYFRWKISEFFNGFFQRNLEKLNCTQKDDDASFLTEFF